MAGDGDPITIRAMTAADVEFGMRLAGEAGWNQTEADWRRMLSWEPGGLFLAELAPGGEPAGTAATVRYGARVAWIGMVLVAPRYRRRGVATRLMGRCIERLRGLGVESVGLDATPAGREVYARLGFRAEMGLARYEGVAQAEAPAPSTGVEPMRPRDLPEVAALDARVFGAARGALLAAFLDDLPEACHVLRRAGAVEGFIVGRHGANAAQLGPCAAASPDDARALIAAVLAALGGRRVFADLVTDNGWARGLAVSSGLIEQRPFTRMSLGEGRLPGDASGAALVAGPEYG